MRSFLNALALAVVAGTLVACGSAESPDAAEQAQAPDPAAEPALEYEPVASVLDLMRGTITLSAETYWESVSIILSLDEDGEPMETINQPETDNDWLEIWSAGITLAESGNLLMLPRTGFPEDEEWNQYARQLREAGILAAAAATRKDYMEVLEVGNTVYRACGACHEVFMPTLNL